MKYRIDCVSEEIDAFERRIDEVRDGLPIYKLPLHLALFTTLTQFEEANVKYRSRGIPVGQGYIRPGIGVSHLRKALHHLVPQLVQRCKVSPVNKKGLQDLKHCTTPTIYASQSLDFFQRYSSAAYLLTGYRQGWFSGAVKDREIVFFHPNMETETSLIHHSIGDLHDNFNFEVDLLKKTLPYPQRVVSLKSALRHKNQDQYLTAIPKDLLDSYRNHVLSQGLVPTMDEAITLNDYSIGDYYRFWVDLSAMMLAYVEACEVKFLDQSRQLTNARILPIRIEDLVNLVASQGRVSVDACQGIVRDLQFCEVNPDIQVRPLVPTPQKDFLFLSPHLIFNSAWEVCLLRNWAKISPKYGQLIGREKEQGLADQLCAVFDKSQVKTAVRRKIKSRDGNLIGDVDLAVYDETNGDLVLAELKWLLQPDSFQEESNSRHELLHGLDQLYQISEMFTADKEWLLEQIYPGENFDKVRRVKFCLICHGDIGLNVPEKYSAFNLLDYEITLNQLRKHEPSSASARFDEVFDLHATLRKQIIPGHSYFGMKIAGYLFRQPVVEPSRILYTKPMPTYAAAKSFCTCGSGKPYADCCQIIEALKEGSITPGQFEL